MFWGTEKSMKWRSLCYRRLQFGDRENLSNNTHWLPSSTKLNCKDNKCQRIKTKWFSVSGISHEGEVTWLGFVAWLTNKLEEKMHFW